MQILLLKDVEGLGRAGDIKEAAGGYATYLVSQKLASPVTAGAVRQAQTIKEAAERKRDRRTTEAKALAAKLEGKIVTFQARAGEGDRLYGSITNADVADKLSGVAGAEIERRLVELEHPIKSLGEHKALVRLGSGVTATVYVQVERAEDAR